MSLHAILLSFLTALAPADLREPDVPAVLTAIEGAVEAEKAPVFGAREADALVLTAIAHFESNFHLHATGDHGQAHGAFQLHSPAGLGSAPAQARAALEWLRRDRSICPRNPVQAFVSGGCWRGHREAMRRMLAIQAALRRSGVLSSRHGSKG